MGKSVIITPEQAKNGIYIDFEGLKKVGDERCPLPHVLGCVIGHEKHAFLLRENYAPVARSSNIDRWDSVTTLSIDEAVKQLLERAKAEHRFIFSYTEHELRVVKKHCLPEVLTKFENCFINAKLIVKRWRNACHGGKKPEGNSLKEYFELIDYNTGVEPDFQMTKVLKSMDKELQKTKFWRNIDMDLKTDWVNLLRYNLGDCKGLQRLTVKAANGIAAKFKKEM